MATETPIHSFTYYIPETGDTISEVYRTEHLSNNRKRETVDKYINGVFISVTVTDFVNGYKNGYQLINKENGNGTSQSFTNYYIEGVLQENHS